jgi:hypothetical protein
VEFWAGFFGGEQGVDEVGGVFGGGGGGGGGVGG